MQVEVHVAQRVDLDLADAIGLRQAAGAEDRRRGAGDLGTGLARGIPGQRATSNDARDFGGLRTAVGAVKGHPGRVAPL
jgi:hypothetical protein